MTYDYDIKEYTETLSLCRNARFLLEDNILYRRSFDQTWSNTGTIWAYPNSGMVVGSGFTTATVTVIFSKHGSAVVFVYDRLAYIIKHPNDAFIDDISKHDMDYVNTAKSRYEKV